MPKQPNDEDRDTGVAHSLPLSSYSVSLPFLLDSILLLLLLLLLCRPLVVDKVPIPVVDLVVDKVPILQRRRPESCRRTSAV